MQSDLSQIRKSALVQDIITWLESTDEESILNYAKVEPEKIRALIADIKGDIVTNLRICRNIFLSDVLDTNAPIILNEAQILKMIASLINYDQQSVIKNYLNTYKDLSWNNTDTPVTEWARKTLNVWRLAFKLFTVFDFYECGVYLKSFVKSYSGDALASIKELCSQAQSLTIDQISSNDYEGVLPHGELSVAVRKLFTEIDFLPSQYIEDMERKKVGSELYYLLRNLNTVLNVIDGLNGNGADISNEELLLDMLWDSLALDEEMNTIAGYESCKSSIINVDSNSYEYKLIQSLSNVITIANIENEDCEKLLHSYITNLNNNQKNKFLGILKGVLINSPEIQVIFDPVDVGWFVDSMENENLLETKEDVINELQRKIVPEFWPLAKKTMLMLATIF